MHEIRNERQSDKHTKANRVIRHTQKEKQAVSSSYKRQRMAEKCSKPTQPPTIRKVPVNEIREPPKSAETDGIRETRHEKVPFVVPGRAFGAAGFHILHDFRHFNLTPANSGA